LLPSLFGQSIIAMGILILVCNKRRYQNNEEHHDEILLGCLITFGIGA
jgi:hypothetical protein